METIQTKINRFYSLIENYYEAAPNTRYKSWEWCHKTFLENRENNDEATIDLLSLHLAFYLASWGMYRGSSFLLQRDYKAHKGVVKEILKSKYRKLWDYNPTEDNIEEANDLLFKKEADIENCGIYWKIKSAYKYEEDETIDDEASDTLATKILMGTFGCIPAFDRYLKSGIKWYKNNVNEKIGNYELIPTIEHKCKGQIEATESFKALALFAIENGEQLVVNSQDIEYPPMKCVDMYFWEIGYELDIVSLLEKEKSEKKQEKLLKKAIELKYCREGSTIENAIKQIKQLNSESDSANT